jgi:hypothetical protein
MRMRVIGSPAYGGSHRKNPKDNLKIQTGQLKILSVSIDAAGHIT